MNKEQKRLEERTAKIWETIKRFEYKEYSLWVEPQITNSKIITEYPEFIIYAIHPKCPVLGSYVGGPQFYCERKEKFSSTKAMSLKIPIIEVSKNGKNWFEEQLQTLSNKYNF